MNPVERAFREAAELTEPGTRERVTPCPCCDVERLAADAAPKPDHLGAFAYGVAVGAAFAGDLHGVTERMCDEHRFRWLKAMTRAAILSNTPVGSEPCGVCHAEQCECPR